MCDLVDGYKEQLEKQELELKQAEADATTEEEPEEPKLTIQEKIAAMIDAYLEYEEVQPGKSEYKMFTYFYAEWEDGVGKVSEQPIPSNSVTDNHRGTIRESVNPENVRPRSPPSP